MTFLRQDYYGGFRRSDAEDAAAILQGRGYLTRIYAEGDGVVMFVHPDDIGTGGVFGVLRITDKDVIRHSENPEERIDDLAHMVSNAETEWRFKRSRYGR